jgi:hypothetical protein
MIRDRTIRTRVKLVGKLPTTGEVLRGSLLERTVRHTSRRPGSRALQKRGYKTFGAWNSENSKANRIETMKGPAESGQICSVGRRKIAKKIANHRPS